MFHPGNFTPAFVLFIVVTVFPPLPFNVTEIVFGVSVGFVGSVGFGVSVGFVGSVGFGVSSFLSTYKFLKLTAPSHKPSPICPVLMLKNSLSDSLSASKV